MVDLITVGIAIIEIPLVAIATIFFMDILPNNMKLWIQFQARSFKKGFQKPSIDVTLISKTPDITLKRIDAEELTSRLSEGLGKAGFNVAKNGFDLVSDLVVGESDTRIRVSPAVSYEETEEEQEDGQVIKKEHTYISQVQLSLVTKAKFSGLAEHLLELREAQQKVIDSIREIVSFQPNRVLTCKLNTVNELTGMLSKYNINLLSANYDKTRIDLSGDKIIITSESLTAPVVALLRKMIVMYY